MFSIDAATGVVSFIDRPDFEAPADAGGDKKAEDFLTRGIPMRRLAEPEEITRSMLWICDPRNYFMTGQAVALDGGTSAM